jgi:hypothetical protein
MSEPTCEVKQSQLSSLYNNIARELDVTDESISYIMGKLKSIHNYSEPEEKINGSISEKQESTLVNELNQQLQRLNNYNSKLNFIIRHLNEII